MTDFSATTNTLVGMVPVVVGGRLLAGAAGARGRTKQRRRLVKKVVKPKVRKRSVKRATRKTKKTKRR